MFKLHYNVYEKVEELAKLLAQSSEYTELQAAEDEDVMQISKRLIQQNRVAYEELAK